MAEKKIKTLMMRNADEYEYYAKSLIPKGAVEKIENGARRLIVNCKNCYIQAIYPGFYVA